MNIFEKAIKIQKHAEKLLKIVQTPEFVKVSETVMYSFYIMHTMLKNITEGKDLDKSSAKLAEVYDILERLVDDNKEYLDEE